MDGPAMTKILYLVGVGLLLTFDLLACVDSQVPDDIWFSLNGTTYQNNSIVTLEDIGEDDTALLCMTNFTACCRRPYTGENGTASGNWFLPNETRVPNANETSREQWDFYSEGGEAVVLLNRRRGGVEGIYRCEIPDLMNVNQTRFIGVYTADTGSPNVTSLTFDDKTRTLTCTSTGGPATTVTWRRDEVMITLNATHQQTKRLIHSTNGTYQTVLTIDPSVGWSDIVGTYNCTVENDRGESSETVVVPDDVWFSLNGTTYQNNSIVTLEDVGERDEALLCITNLTACCRLPYTDDNVSVIGNWFFPNGTRVPNFGDKWDFHRSRGQMVVRLDRRRGGEDGIYHCKIPDAMNVTQNIYIGVYTAISGSPTVTSLTFDDQSRTLTCTSTGGPATTVTWRKDGVVITLNATYHQTKRLVDPPNGTYQTVLTIDPSVDWSDVVGTYNCTVENIRRESSDTVIVPGYIRFSFNGTTYQNNSLVTLGDIGENDTALLCMTNFTACCRPPYTDPGFPLGKWFFPNGTIVPSNFVDGTKSITWDFYRDRGQMMVRMKRRRGGKEGIYRCEIPDSTNITQAIFIGVYNASTGSPTVTNLSFDDQSRTLTCTSTGGPATTVTWRRDGVVITLNATHQQTKRIVDNVTSTYQTVLTINSSVGWSDIEGTYNCTVENDRGESSETVVVPDVWFSLNGTTYQNNSIVTLEDIGENDDALLCKTHQIACCRSSNDSYTSFVSGNWFFPNGTRVFSGAKDPASYNNNTDFYRDRGQMVVRLKRRRGGEEGIYCCEIPDSANVTQTIYIGVYTANNGTPIVTGLTFDDESRTVICNSTGGPATTVTWRRDGIVITLNATYQQTKRLIDNRTSTYQTVLTINSSVGWSDFVGTYNCTVENDRGESSETVIVSASKPDSSQTVRAASPLQTVGTTTITGTVLVSSSTQPTNNPPSDGATTTSVIIVAAVVILLVVIVVGVVLLVVVLFRAKKKKQQLEINRLQNVMTVKEDFEMKLKQEETTKVEASSNANQPPYAEIQTEAPPNVPSKSQEVVEYLNQKNPLTVGYSEIEPEQADIEHTLPGKPPRHVSLSDSMSEEKELNPTYQNRNQCHDLPNTTNVSQGNDVYTVPDITSSHTVDPESEIYETVYSEPIQPSLFTDAAETPSNAEDLHPYAPIYTIPINLPESKKMLLKVFGSNIREIGDLGMGQFGKVILAETVGLSMKDLRLSESDDDKSKSTLVAVKKLKSDAPSTTKEAFEKEVNFMSRLTDANVIRVLGVCYEDTPFIMMEYLEKGDLNQYLQKFKVHSTTDSEPQGQITTRTLVHITTQIASAMKYLASHNFVHRDLATRNCLVGPNYLVKISDFGMSRNLYDSHYYRIHGRFALPVRWMAFECFYGKFSQKTDVWAFGVTMWEIFTLAKEQPYTDMSEEQLIENALKGKNRKILAKPDMCPLEVYKIALECWAYNAEQRATFQKLVQLLTSVHHNI